MLAYASKSSTISYIVMVPLEFSMTASLSPTSTTTTIYQPCVAYNIIPGGKRRVRELHVEAPRVVVLWLKHNPQEFFRGDPDAPSRYDPETKQFLFGNTTLVHGAESIGLVEMREAIDKLMRGTYVSFQGQCPWVNTMELFYDVDQPEQLELYVSPFCLKMCQKRTQSCTKATTIAGHDLRINVEVKARDRTHVTIDSLANDGLRVVLGTNLDGLGTIDPRDLPLFHQYKERILAALRMVDRHGTSRLLEKDRMTESLARIGGWTYPGYLNLSPDFECSRPVTITRKAIKFLRSCINDKYTTSNGHTIAMVTIPEQMLYDEKTKTLQLSHKLWGQEAVIPHDVHVGDYRRNMRQVEEALLELRSVVEAKLPPIVFTQDEFRYATEVLLFTFRSSSGLRLTFTRVRVGRGRIVDDMGTIRVIIGPDQVDKEWVPSKEEGRHSYREYRQSIQDAISEFKEHVRRQLPCVTRAMYEYLLRRNTLPPCMRWMMSKCGLEIEASCTVKSLYNRSRQILFVGEDCLDRPWMPHGANADDIVSIRVAVEELKAATEQAVPPTVATPVPTAVPSLPPPVQDDAPRLAQKFKDDLAMMEAIGVERSVAIGLLLKAGGDLVKAMETMVQSIV